MEKELVYGVSSKEMFGTWEHKVYVFEDHELASQWLGQEEFDFRERELMSRDAAVDLADEQTVAYAEQDITREI